MGLKKHLLTTVAILTMAFWGGTMQCAAVEITDNTTADITFLPGTLNMAQMSAFSFNPLTISSTPQSSSAQQSSVYLDIHDLRGSGVGWKVTAVASQFTSNASPSLPGARLFLNNGAATATPPTIGDNPVVVQTITLDADGTSSANIATAAVGQGLGNWSLTWASADVSISVPGGVATAGTHTSIITWTLTDAP